MTTTTTTLITLSTSLSFFILSLIWFEIRELRTEVKRIAEIATSNATKMQFIEKQVQLLQKEAIC